MRIIINDDVLLIPLVLPIPMSIKYSFGRRHSGKIYIPLVIIKKIILINH